MRLADLDPRFLLWLRAQGYINGLGPRTIKVWRWKFRSPFHLPTPGMTPAFEQHDLDYLLGGSEMDRHLADLDLSGAFLVEADDTWGLRAWLLLQAREPVYEAVRDNGASHFRHRFGGPRTEDELQRELGYAVAV